jgi:hypothetical protein
MNLCSKIKEIVVAKYVMIWLILLAVRKRG